LGAVQREVGEGCGGHWGVYWGVAAWQAGGVNRERRWTAIMRTCYNKGKRGNIRKEESWTGLAWNRENEQGRGRAVLDGVFVDC
jgi:hypothetical protein